nr:MAG TPA: hypothetical protein [Caudoviricetes sp.]
MWCGFEPHIILIQKPLRTIHASLSHELCLVQYLLRL